MPLDFSLAVMRAMDALRARLGMRFPCEAAPAPAGG
jgi:hypothetical protein